MATIKSVKVKPKKKLPTANSAYKPGSLIGAAAIGNYKPADFSTVDASKGSGNLKTAKIPMSDPLVGANKVPVTPVPSANNVNDQLAMMEQQQSNIYDPTIGYGTAMPGETGTAAVDRIKKARVKRKAK